MSKIFIDTNILVYTSDEAQLQKQEKAHQMLGQLKNTGNGVVSTQILQEFYAAVTRKLKIDPIKARGLLRTLEVFELVIVDYALIKEAVDSSILNHVSFWDALMVVSARSAQCGTIWTEDLNSGQIIDGVRIENPLLSH